MALGLVLLEFLLERVEVVTVGTGRILDQWEGDRFVFDAVHSFGLPTQQRIHEK